MKKLMLAACITVLACSFTFFKKTPRILVFCKTAGYHHQSIAVGKVAIMQLGAAHHFDVDTTADSTVFTDKNLKKYAAVVFLSTTGNVLNDEQQAAFEKYIRAGHGFVGVHAATDTEYDWPWYNKLVGAYFKSHPKQQEAVLHVTDSSFIASKHLPATWKRKDEWYNFKTTNWDDVHVLITIDESSYTGGENGNYHPMSWYHNYDGGRSFYTELGHTDESYADPLYLQHLLGGIEYAIGE
ncbi:ThuA domain-containing protein [Deminuibacter soli]|uniref:ThuA domain-containing protein n=1 Tax=Deminuibacter soli TaxID=2291815 RepID=A0A3E1NGV0_9BACT|nr:ThuA domain-containing protein [Deminuibacter soli]RFM27180.1 ThuA domain-containing protein [Deminuibacter soli]